MAEMDQVGGQAWVGSDGFVAARFVQIGDGSVEEERKYGEAMRRETRRKKNEMKKE